MNGRWKLNGVEFPFVIANLLLSLMTHSLQNFTSMRFYDQLEVAMFFAVHRDFTQFQQDNMRNLTLSV